MKRTRALRGKCSYQTDWEKTFSWVKAVPKDIYSAECKLCSKSFNIDSMGRAALVSHAKGAKHILKEQNIAKSAPLDLWVRPSSSSNSSTPFDNPTSTEGSNATKTVSPPSTVLPSIILHFCLQLLLTFLLVSLQVVFPLILVYGSEEICYLKEMR